MSIPQYKPGDKVWIKFINWEEVPDEIVATPKVPEDFMSWCGDHPGHYFVSLKEYGAACTLDIRRRLDNECSSVQTGR